MDLDFDFGCVLSVFCFFAEQLLKKRWTLEEHGRKEPLFAAENNKKGPCRGQMSGFHGGFHDLPEMCWVFVVVVVVVVSSSVDACQETMMCRLQVSCHRCVILL